MSRYRFALRPAWLLSHVLVLLLAAVLVSLGLWQLRRLDERQASNAEVVARSEGDPVPVEDLLDPGQAPGEGPDQRWENVVATGTYQPADQVFVRSRALDGNPGFWVLTPLLRADGTALVVNRGWVPFRAETDASDVELETPAGTVTVSGLLQPSVSPPRASEGTAGERRNVTVAHADLGWFDQRVDYDLYPWYLQLEEQEPAPVGDLPVILPEPDLSDGPHLSYAGQWFIFATIAVIGYPLVLRRVARSGGGVEDSDEPRHRGDPDPVQPSTPAGVGG